MKDIVPNVILFFVMILAQVLICDRIAIFNVAVPIVFIYFIIRLPIDINPSLLYTLAFLSGLSVDIFSDMPGVNALACTLVSAMKKPMFFAYVQRDDRTKDIIPSLSTLGFATYSKFLLTIVTVYCLLTFTLEYFNFADVKHIVIMTAASSALSFAILLGVDSLMLSGKKK